MGIFTGVIFVFICIDISNISKELTKIRRILEKKVE